MTSRHQQSFPGDRMPLSVTCVKGIGWNAGSRCTESLIRYEKVLKRYDERKRQSRAGCVSHIRRTIFSSPNLPFFFNSESRTPTTMWMECEGWYFYRRMKKVREELAGASCASLNCDSICWVELIEQLTPLGEKGERFLKEAETSVQRLNIVWTCKERQEKRLPNLE